MSIRVTCPTCAKKLTVGPEAKAKRVKCPVCADVFPVPASQPAEESLAAVGQRLTSKQKPSSAPNKEAEGGKTSSDQSCRRAWWPRAAFVATLVVVAGLILAAHISVRAGWKQQLAAAEEQADDSRKQTDELTRSLNRAEKQLRVARDEVVTLRRQLAESELLAKAAQAADARAKESETRVENLTKRLAEANRRAKESEARVEEVTRRLAEAERLGTEAQAKLDDLTKRLAQNGQTTAPASRPASVEVKGPMPEAKVDPGLDGEWALDKSHSVYTGAEKHTLLVSREHKLSIKGGAVEVTGYVEGEKRTTKYTLEVDASAKPKRFKQTNPSNPDDDESGIYWVKDDVLLMRTEKFGKATPEWGFSDIRTSSTDNAGQDADIPEGFLLKKGDNGATILAFHKVKPKK